MLPDIAQRSYTILDNTDRPLVQFFLLVLWEFKLFPVLGSCYFLVLFVIFFSASLCFPLLCTPQIVSGVPKIGLVVFFVLLPEFWSVVLHLVLPFTSLICMSQSVGPSCFSGSVCSLWAQFPRLGDPLGGLELSVVAVLVLLDLLSSLSVLLGLFSQVGPRFPGHQCIPCCYLFFSFFSWSSFLYGM